MTSLSRQANTEDRGSPTPTRSAPPGVRDRVSVATLAAALGLYAWLAWARRWVSEDAFINFRVIRNIFEGHGPVFNPGERVEAYTSPLWVLMQVVGRGLFRPVPLEVVALLGGLALSLLGLAAGAAAALRLERWHARSGVALPFGLIIVVALPPFWDFATSGLETGLTFAWLGGCFWGLVSLGPRREVNAPVGRNTPTLPARLPRAAVWLALLVGLGPLVRPDLFLFTSVFLVAIVAIIRPVRLSDLIKLGLIAGAIPAAYQIFRMGYFAALVPNTALAKEAFGARWGQGFAYVRDLVAPYWLWVPMVPLGAWWARRLEASRRPQHRVKDAPALAMLVGGLAHVLYVVAIGGDFMHGRFLLPGVFAVVLPAALIRVGRRSAASLLSVAVLVAWASWAGPWLRTQEGEVGPRGIADERGFWVRRATDKTPVTLGSYADTWFARTGRTATAQLGLGRLLLFPKGHDSDEVRAYPMSLSVGPDVVIVAGNVGILGYSANSRVHVVDRGGLGDPHTSRVELAARSRPGHEKSLPVEWVLARFADPTLGPSDPRTEAARRALRCGRLRTLSEAVSEPLTLGRFMRNVLAAPTLTALRIPRDPGEAEVRFC